MEGDQGKKQLILIKWWVISVFFISIALICYFSVYSSLAYNVVLYSDILEIFTVSKYTAHTEHSLIQQIH